jgi:predicted RNA-binding Zn ribbon-like protein
MTRQAVGRLSPRPIVIRHDFHRRDLVGGHAVLDFVNTVNGRDATPADWLDGYERLLEWAALTGAFPRGLLSALRRRARSDAGGARRALEGARAFREALFEVLSALARGNSAPAPALDRVARHWKAAVSASELERTPRGLRPVLRFERTGLDLVSFQIALWVVPLLAEFPDPRLRICDGSGCSWLFLDSSKGGRRRWCDMATCGNVSKARRHYARIRKR